VNTVLIEIRAAEGGDHAKRLVNTQANIYLAFGARRGL
jgi:protein subunit release factor A